MSPSPVSAALSRLDCLAAVLPKRGRLLIFPHDYPDPDALASAAALHLLLNQRYGLHSQIVFSGDVSRAENKELLRRMRYRWYRLQDLRATSRRLPCITVDSAPWSKNVTLPPFAHPIGVIDHHQHARWHDREGMCVDIRAGAGATTTILHEYLKAADIEPPRWLASIMAYAIVSETLDLSRDGDKADIDAYLELVARADMRIIGKIRHAPLPRAYFARLQEAITHACKLDVVAWSHLQSIEQPEIVAEIADLLLRMDGIRWSFCTANLNGGMYVSIRSRQRGARCSRLLRAAIGRNGSAGGHHNLAAGYYRMEGLTPEEREVRRRNLVRILLRSMVRRLPDEVDELIRPLVEIRAPRAPGARAETS